MDDPFKGTAPELPLLGARNEQLTVLCSDDRQRARGPSDLHDHSRQRDGTLCTQHGGPRERTANRIEHTFESFQSLMKEHAEFLEMFRSCMDDRDKFNKYMRTRHVLKACQRTILTQDETIALLQGELAHYKRTAASNQLSNEQDPVARG